MNVAAPAMIHSEQLCVSYCWHKNCLCYQSYQKVFCLNSFTSTYFAERTEETMMDFRINMKVTFRVDNKA